MSDTKEMTFYRERRRSETDPKRQAEYKRRFRKARNKHDSIETLIINYNGCFGSSPPNQKLVVGKSK